MESHVDIEAVRRKANTYLQDLLQHVADRSPQDTASAITQLAFEDGNPVRELFAATHNSAGNTDESPKGSIRSRSSRGLLRLGRLKSASSDSKASMTSQPRDLSQSLGGGLPSTGRVSAKAVPMSSCFSATQRPAKASGSNPYQCIICNESLSSKGVCKRHLEDQHVSPKQYKCEKCAEIFTVKPEVKDHIKDCGKGVFLYVVVKQEEKRVYACEFTGDVFSSMARYLEHLLSLSEKVEGRPFGDLHRKLHGLLLQPNLEPHVAEISQRLYGSPSAWRNLQWNPDQLMKAIEKLEYAVVHESGTLEFSKHVAEQQRRQNAQTYLYSLLCEGTIRSASRQTVRSAPESRRDIIPPSSPMSFDSSRIMTPKASSASLSAVPEDHRQIELDPSIGTTAPPSVPTSIASSMEPSPSSSEAIEDIESDPLTPTEIRSKRHLSDHSRFYVPVRNPPGPPLPVSLPHSYDMNVATSGHGTPLNISTTSLPFRTQDPPYVHNPALAMDVDLHHHPYTPSIPTSVASDAASESTMMSSYHEPELVTPMSFDYPLWHGQQGSIPYALPLAHQMQGYQMSHPAYFDPSSSSTRTPSIATDNTYVVDYNAAEQKALEFAGGQQHHMDGMAQYGGTFLLDDDESNNDGGHRMQS